MGYKSLWRSKEFLIFIYRTHPRFLTKERDVVFRDPHQVQEKYRLPCHLTYRHPNLSRSCSLLYAIVHKAGSCFSSCTLVSSRLGFAIQKTVSTYLAMFQATQQLQPAHDTHARCFLSAGPSRYINCHRQLNCQRNASHQTLIHM